MAQAISRLLLVERIPGTGEQLRGTDAYPLKGGRNSRFATIRGAQRDGIDIVTQAAGANLFLDVGLDRARLSPSP